MSLAKRPAAAPPQKEVEEEGRREEQEEQEEEEEEEEERKIKPPSKEEKKIKPLSKKEKKIKSPSKKRRRICLKRPASKKDDGDHDHENVKHKVEKVWMNQALTGNVRTTSWSRFVRARSTWWQSASMRVRITMDWFRY